MNGEEGRIFFSTGGHMLDPDPVHVSEILHAHINS
jgi:hypothetical protein